MAPPLKTHCLRGHEYTPENTATNHQGGRCCIECRRIRHRKSYVPVGDFPHRILDYLDIYGGWRTALGIATDLNLNPSSTQRILYRMRARGLVIDRAIWMAGGDRRREWRVA